MSRSSYPAEHPPITTPTTAGGQNVSSHGLGASADSSRTSTASAVRTENYGGYGGAPHGTALAEHGLGTSSRRPSAELTTQTPSRVFGVHSILNHPVENESSDPTRGRQAGQLGANPTQPLLPRPADSPYSRKRTDPSSPGREHDGTHSARRRLLTPKSPGPRAASLGARRNPAFHTTIQPLLPPSNTARRQYTAEPGPYQSSDVPPLPLLAITTDSRTSSLVTAEFGQPRSGILPESPARTLESLATPSSDRIPRHTLQQANLEHPSPSYRYGNPPPPSQSANTFRPLSTGGPSVYGDETHSHGPHEGYQQGSASYQMTVDTDQGPMNIPVELDLQQASKVADEKRKRNAGASARFRARRKEKEKEASQTISGLQGEMRELIEERDHYLTERNYFRDLAARHGAQMLQRPQSPQQRRLVAAAATSPSAVTLDNPMLSDDSYRERLEPGPSAQRRRTGDYQPAFVSRQTHSPPPSAFRPTFPSQPPLPLPPPPPVQGSYGTPRTLPNAPQPPGVTRSQSYDPFRRESFDRNWSSRQ